MTGALSRAEILRRFEDWLDTALAAEEPPSGVEAEILAAVSREAEDSADGQPPAGDYSLWSAMTALTQEVRLQGRSFKELNETLGAQANRTAERERELQEAERRGRKELLTVLVDLRDRFGRGMESMRANEEEMAKSAGRGWLSGILRRKESTAATVEALKKGYALSLERLDQTLEDFNAHKIVCQGQPFDPRRMNAVDRQESATLAEGTVIEVYRSGYEWNGEVFRPAQVKVACAPAGKANE